MKWTLFARLEQVVARARRLDASKDRVELARLLVEHNPELGADQDAALTMAKAALIMLGQLPGQIDEAAASIVDANPLAPVEALARVAALAYVALCEDLLPDDMPGGCGLIDDAISLRAAGVGAPNGWDQDERARRLTELGIEARFLSLFLPRARLDEFNQALRELFRTVAIYTHAPLEQLKSATRRLIEEPPKSLAELLPARAGEAESRPPKLFEARDASLELDGQVLRFRFDDGVVLELNDGHLRLVD